MPKALPCPIPSVSASVSAPVSAIDLFRLAFDGFFPTSAPLEALLDRLETMK